MGEVILLQCEYCGGKHLDAKCQERCKDEIWESTAMIELIDRQLLQAKKHLLNTRNRLHECCRSIKVHRVHLGTKGQSRLHWFHIEVHHLIMDRDRVVASIKDKEAKIRDNECSIAEARSRLSELKDEGKKGKNKMHAYFGQPKD